MINVIIDTIIDSIKLFPFLFVAFIIIEFTEHKLKNKNKIALLKSGRVGPIIGSLLGIIPQCGFSVLATNLYITRIISLGTLIAIYLSTSDEMLPILIAHHASLFIIIKILLIKLFVGIIFGILIDLIFSKKENNINYHICDEEDCDCKHSLVKSSFIHTLKTFVFIFLITFVLNFGFYFIGEETLKSVLSKENLLTPFISALIGLIPNCGASVILTELYLKDMLSLGSTIAGLLSSSGIALLILFKSNKNIKENMFIILNVYCIGVLVGLIIEITNFII
jgi:hypothetical protein